ncbi:TraK family protein [Halodesulfovibrio marinisediminis]|uniref:TraK protein n=1 Tax=Halodesulfovibrio marinisediminis DSM 17456 TaxID=1121457 RepID=A0A1N6FFI8_9BACT|nr:TraK family protein [Halodesulfovibrio marinisediminis]SIN94058.1 hypothetical protein SAMN02745161_1288 [Halodesulfovibrio marinisediminis DSM 17456]
MSKKRLGFARVEFIACKPEIDKLLAAGYTIIGAHEVLREKGKITMGYGRFTQLLRKGVKRSFPTPQKEKARDMESQPAQTKGSSIPTEERVLGVVEANSFKKKNSDEELI